MKNKFKTKMMLTAAALAVLTGTACMGVSAENSEEPVNLVFLRAERRNKKEAFTQLLADFMEEYPNITVEYQEAPWGNDFETN